MKRKHIILAAIAILLIIAALTNPNDLRHKDAVKNKLTSFLEQKGEMRSVLAIAMIQRTVESIVSRDNYLFFSLTKINWQGDSKTVGLGIFGNVITFGKINKLANSGS